MKIKENLKTIIKRLKTMYNVSTSGVPWCNSPKEQSTMPILLFSRFLRSLPAILGLALAAGSAAQEWIRDEAFVPNLVRETAISDGLILTPRLGGGYIVTGGYWPSSGFVAVGSSTVLVRARLNEDFSVESSTKLNLELPLSEGSYPPPVSVYPVGSSDDIQLSTLSFVPLGRWGHEQVKVRNNICAA
jgi:hypothetical protein